MKKIFAEIRDTVEEEAEKEVSLAKRVAEREIEHAKRDADEILSACRSDAEQEAGILMERADARRAMRIRHDRMQQLQSYCDEIFSEARQRIEELPRDDAYYKWCTRMLKKAKAMCPQGARVACAEKDKDFLAPLIREEGMECDDTPADIAGGILLHSADGRLTIDCSADAELRAFESEHRDEVIQRCGLVTGETAHNKKDNEGVE